MLRVGEAAVARGRRAHVGLRVRDGAVLQRRHVVAVHGLRVVGVVMMCVMVVMVVRPAARVLAVGELSLLHHGSSRRRRSHLPRVRTVGPAVHVRVAGAGRAAVAPGALQPLPDPRRTHADP